MARAKAKYTLEADDRTERGLRSAQNRLKAFASSVRVGVATAITGIGLAIAAWGKGLQTATGNMKELRGAAADLNQSLEEAQSVRLFAELQDADPGQVNAAIERLKIRIGELIKGEETAVELFKELNLTAEQLGKQTGFGQLLTVGAALRGAAPGRQAKIRDELVGGGTGRLFAGDFVSSAQRAGQLGLTENLSELDRNANKLSDTFAETSAIVSRGIDELTLGGATGALTVQAAEIMRDAIQYLVQGPQGRSGQFTIQGNRVEQELIKIRTAVEAGQVGRFGQ